MAARPQGYVCTNDDACALWAGKELVVWRDAEGQWRCFQDKCPHRCTVLHLLHCWFARQGGLAADWPPVAFVFDRLFIAPPTFYMLFVPASSAPTAILDIWLPLAFSSSTQNSTFHLGFCRLAPLSEGRIEPSDGTLQCSYHGAVRYNYCCHYNYLPPSV